MNPDAILNRPNANSHAAPAWRTILAALAFVVAIAPTAHRVARDFTVPEKIDPQLNGMKDFRDAVYFPVVAFQNGISPYHAEYREFHPEGCDFPAFSPLTLLVHYPLGWLPLRIAAWSYFCLSSSLVLLLAALAIHCCGWEARIDRMFALAALIALSRPGHIDLYLGQLGLETAIGALIALHYAKGRPWIAGLGLAFVSIKPNFAIPLALLMLCRRDYRAVLIGVTVGAVGAAAATLMLVANYGSPSEFIHGIVQDYAAFQQPAIPQTALADGRIDVVSLASRLVEGPLGGWAKLALFGGCLAIGAVGALALRGTKQSEGAGSLSGVLIVLAVLTCIYHQIYDAVLLTAPLLAVANKQTHWASSFERIVLLILLALPAVNYLATMQAVAIIPWSATTWNAVMSVNAAALLLALIICCGRALRLRAVGETCRGDSP